MDSSLRVHGQSVQPVLATFPLGLFGCAALFDVADVLGAPGLIGQVGYWTAVAGLIAAALAAVAGMVELWDAQPDGGRREALAGNLPNVASAVLFIVVCLARAGAGERHPSSSGLVTVEISALAIGIAGIVLAGRRARRAERERHRAEGSGFEAFAAGPAGFLAGESPLR